MNCLVSILSFLFILDSNDTDVLRHVRTQFHSDKTEDILIQIVELDTTGLSAYDSNIILAYKGICLSMMAEYKFSPLSKYEYFLKGKGLLEASIAANQSMENTYLRLLLQLNIPAFLGYQKDIESDLSYLLETLAASDLEVSWKQKFIDTLLKTESNKCELNSLKSIYFE
jgi:hypothetical protein